MITETPTATAPSTAPRSTSSGPNGATPLRRIRRYLIDNPMAGLRTPLRGAPASTWALVPLLMVVAPVVGLVTGQMELQGPSLWRALFLPVVLVVFPTLVEEFFHRGILLPRSLLSAGPRRRFAAATASTAVYVSVHPISPLLGWSDSAFFLDPWMLAIVALLGYACAYAYLRSGSLRAPMLIHWATVVAWNLFLGGVYSG